MKNEHLVPVNIIDLVNKLDDKTIRENERNNYVLRLEAIRDYTTTCLNKYSRDRNSFLSKEARSKLNYSRIGRNNI
jgi:hypothetical protein